MCERSARSLGGGKTHEGLRTLTSGVLLDTGPLVAFLNRRDRYHIWAKAQLAVIRPPLLTCEAVLSETCFLLRKLDGGTDAVFRLLEREMITVRFRLDEEVQAVRKLMARYGRIPMSLADACLVRMTEQHSGSALLTLDPDFRIYRRHGRQVIPALTPEVRSR